VKKEDIGDETAPIYEADEPKKIENGNKVVVEENKQGNLFNKYIEPIKTKYVLSAIFAICILSFIVHLETNKNKNILDNVQRIYDYLAMHYSLDVDISKAEKYAIEENNSFFKDDGFYMIRLSSVEQNNYYPYLPIGLFRSTLYALSESAPRKYRLFFAENTREWPEEIKKVKSIIEKEAKKHLQISESMLEIIKMENNTYYSVKDGILYRRAVD
jgi:hypothetical protein